MFFLDIRKAELKEISQEESKRVRGEVYSVKHVDFHFLAFCKRLKGVAPVEKYLKLYFGDDEIAEIEKNLIREISTKREVCSFYPKADFTVYPWEDYSKDESDGQIDVRDMKKHFKDVLYINDSLLKTRYLFVELSHAPQNTDTDAVLVYLWYLLSDSTTLEAVYIDGARLTPTNDVDPLYVMTKDDAGEKSKESAAPRFEFREADFGDVKKLREIADDLAQYGYFSIAVLQRKYAFGFCKAAKVIDALIEAGLAVKEKNASGVGSRYRIVK